MRDPNLDGFPVIKTTGSDRIKFQAAASGLWYDDPDAAGEICAVKLVGTICLCVAATAIAFVVNLFL